MARGVPLDEYESRVPVQEGLRRIVPETRPSNIGNAISAISSAGEDALNHIQTSDAAAHVAAAVPQAHVQAAQIMNDALQQPQDVIDKAGGITPYVMKQFNQYANDAVAQAPNPLARNEMAAHMNTLGASTQMKAMQTDAEYRVKSRIQSAEQGIDSAATAVQLDPTQLDTMGKQQIDAQRNLAVDPDTRLALGQKTHDALYAAAARGFADKDPGDVLNRLKDPGDAVFSQLSLQQRETTEHYAKDQLAGNEAQGIVDFYRSTGDAYKGADALKAFNDNPKIPFDVKQVAQDKVRQGVGLWQQEQRDHYKDTIIGLEDRIGSGQATLADRGTVLSMGQKGVYAPDRVGTMLGEIDRQQKKKVDDQVDLFNATQAYKNGTPMDPHEPATKNGINKLFNSTSAPIGSQEWVNYAADISRKTGVTPDYAIDHSRAALVSGNVEDRVQAADTIQRLQDANPRGIGYALDDKDKAMAKGINDLRAAGVDPAKAVQMVDQRAQITPAEQERYKELYNQKVQKQALPTLDNMVKADPRLQDSGLFGTGLFTHAPAAPPVMQGEFEELRKNYFPLTGGDVKQANTLAYQDLKHQWGVSEVNGPRELMRFAPEVMNPGLTAPYLRDDMAKAATATGVDSALAAKAHLTPDSEATFHSQGQLWNISVPDKNGLYDVVRGQSGRALIYALPSAAASHAATIQQQRQAGMDKAREMIAKEHTDQQAQLDEVARQAQQGGAF